MFARENGTSSNARLIRMRRRRRITDGSLKLTDTDRTSRSYTDTTSTFPWHQSVIAFCQWTTLRGSHVALRRSVCSINNIGRVTVRTVCSVRCCVLLPLSVDEAHAACQESYACNMYVNNELS